MNGARQAGHQGFQGQKQDRIAGFDSLDAQGDGQVGLANPRRTQDDHVMGAFDEAQPGQFAHQAAVQAGLEVEVELLQGLDPGETRLAQPGFDAFLVATLPFG